MHSQRADFSALLSSLVKSDMDSRLFLALSLYLATNFCCCVLYTPQQQQAELSSTGTQYTGAYNGQPPRRCG